jgi:hypothetical protein
MTASDPKGSAKFSVKQWDGIHPEQGVLHIVPRRNDATRGRRRIARFFNSLIVRLCRLTQARPTASRVLQVVMTALGRESWQVLSTDVYRGPPITTPCRQHRGPAARNCSGTKTRNDHRSSKRIASISRAR